MILSDLSLSQSLSSADVKAEIEKKLGQVLPAGSYTVVVRSYQGDFRARSTNQARINAMILLDRAGKQAALEHKNTIEQMGFKVGAGGDVQLN